MSPDHRPNRSTPHRHREPTSRHCPSCGSGLPRLERPWAYCPFCGKPVPPRPPPDRFCPLCGTARSKSTDARRRRRAAWTTTAAKVRREIGQARRVSQEVTSDVRPETLAACLSICPGLGQVYNGQFFRGILFFVGTIVLVGVGLGFLVWAWSAWHAYHTARELRHGRPSGSITHPPRTRTTGHSAQTVALEPAVQVWV